jgi:hypothetical protein
MDRRKFFSVFGLSTVGAVAATTAHAAKDMAPLREALDAGMFANCPGGPILGEVREIFSHYEAGSRIVDPGHSHNLTTSHMPCCTHSITGTCMATQAGGAYEAVPRTRFARWNGHEWVDLGLR